MLQNMIYQLVKNGITIKRSNHLFALQLARVAFIDLGMADEELAIYDADGHRQKNFFNE